MPLVNSTGLWLGEQDSFEVALKAYQWKMEHPTEAAAYKTKYEDEDELLDMLVDAIYQEKDNLAIITVSGSMVNEDSYWNLIFGMTSYNTVSAALNRAVEDEDITDIVTNYSTSGGDAEGISAVSENIKIAKTFKPVHSFSNTMALSAGYWMAASGTKLYGSPMSEWGSIGAITTHTSVAEALKARGYDVKVYRGGEFKVLCHPAEKRSKKCDQALTERTHKMYNFFLEEISGERPQLKLAEKDAWAEGRVFFAQEALELKLIDKVTTFNDLIASLTQLDEGGTEPPGTTGLISSEVNAMPKQVILDQASQAQLASGADLSTLEHTETEVEEPEGTTALEDGTPGEAESPPAEESQDTTLSAPEGATTELVSYLKGELATARSDLATANASVATLQQKADDNEVSVSALKPIAIEATQRLQVALGQSPVEMKSFTPEMLSQQYSTVNKAFTSRFKAGKQSLGAEDVGAEVGADAQARKIGIVPVAQA